MELSDIRALLQPELEAMDQFIAQHIPANINLVNSLTEHITQAGGKRLRPMTLFLTAKALNYQGQDHIALAAAAELLHTATLLHDDVVDASSLRRGRKTANELWGNSASVLVGDFLYTRACELTASLNNLEIIHTVVQNTRLLVQGELLQLSHRRNFNMTEKDYLEIIGCKTGQLFELSMHLAALLASRTHVDAAKNYGMNVGIAFQMMDDLLDYQGNAEQIGKNVGDDLRDGSLTLPLLYILQSGHAVHIESVKQAVNAGHIETLQQAIIESGAIAYTQQLAEDYTQQAISALDSFPKNIYTQALIALAHFATKRKH